MLFTLVSFVVVVIAFAMYVYAEKQVDRVNSLRITSFQLADELRQSSEDLTRMVRSYVQTGDPIYKAHFQEVLDIRNGDAYRPVDYQGIYWDLVLTDNKRPRPLSNQKVPLLQLMSEQGFTPEEFAKLAEAKANSDALTQIEFRAMEIIESASPVTDAIRAQA
ncbi:MAG: diguanylate cyclase, partial [Methylophilus sp.]|nr:diguanylate cyclase [Methylophilus sp.]